MRVWLYLCKRSRLCSSCRTKGNSILAPSDVYTYICRFSFFAPWCSKSLHNPHACMRNERAFQCTHVQNPSTGNNKAPLRCIYADWKFKLRPTITLSASRIAAGSRELKSSRSDAPEHLMHAERTSKPFPPIIGWPLVGVLKGSPIRVWPRCTFFWRCRDEWAARMSQPGPEINARRALSKCALNCTEPREERRCYRLQIGTACFLLRGGEHLFIPLRPIDLFIPSHGLLLLTEIRSYRACSLSDSLSRSRSAGR
jgi:hypothetical protein